MPGCCVPDMGPQNRSIWRKLNIVAGKYTKVHNYIEHPSHADKKLFVMPDPVHVFKDLAATLTNFDTIYYIFILNNSLVQEYNLPFNEVSISPIQQVYEIDNDDIIKLCPRLKEKVLNPSHFDKMNVGISVALINHDVSTAIYYCIAEKKIDEKHKTTAWFLSTMHRWFKLMTSRTQTMALSLQDKHKYTEAIDFLKSVQHITYNISVNNTWMPFQTGIILSTETALDFQKLYLEEEHFNYILLSRLTQDALENSFSSIRCRQPVPDARTFKISLRLVCLSQFAMDLKRSSYDEDDANYLVKYCTEVDKIEADTTNKSEERIINGLLIDF